MKGRLAVVTLMTVVIAALAIHGYLRRDYRPVFSRIAGELVAVHDSTEVGRAADGKRLTDVTLVSDTGLRVRVRVRAPGRSDGKKHPATILIGGLDTGRRAAQVPKDTGDLILASIEYPYDGPRDPEGWEWLRYLWSMRQGVLETAPALLLVAQYVYARGDTDPERVSIMGVSLGVPFAAAAAATDWRLSGAMLLHGGGDIRKLISNAYAHVADPWLVELMAIGLAWLWAPLEPTRYVGEISPRPLLMVNATGDEFISRESTMALYDAAHRPKKLLWISSNHVRADSDEIVALLMEMSLEWMTEQGLR